MALGVDPSGNQEILALRACAQESKNEWTCLLQDLQRRSTAQIDLIVTDGHDDLLAAVSELFSATPRQRCLVHKQRDLLNTVPQRERGKVQADLGDIWSQPTKQEALNQLAVFKARYSQRYPNAVRSLAKDEGNTFTFYKFPVAMHQHIQTIDAIEGLLSNVQQRIDQFDMSTMETSYPALVWAIMQDIRFHKVPV
jgi:putative transposase